jgi:hypothetical protein
MYERTRKETHLDTIWYEIDMLEYCFQILTGNPPKTSTPEWNLLIEAYLLHYRNLIQFLGGNEQRHKRHKNDLSTFAPEKWAKRQLTKEEQDALVIPGQKLDDEFSDRISVCLQHCTVERADQLIDWDIVGMQGKIESAITAFKTSFPRQGGYNRVPSESLTATTSSYPVTSFYIPQNPKKD